MKLYMFRTVFLSITRSLVTVHSAVVYVIQFLRQISKRTRMELSSQIYSIRSKFGKLVHLVGFIIKTFVTMHGHTNVKFINVVESTLLCYQYKILLCYFLGKLWSNSEIFTIFDRLSKCLLTD